MKIEIAKLVLEHLKLVGDVSTVLDEQKSAFSLIADRTIKLDQGGLKRFSDYCKLVANSLDSNELPPPISFDGSEELDLFLAVIYYRIARNLVSIRKLLSEVNMETYDFETYEFSIGILLRSALLDSNILFKTITAKDVRKQNVDSFKYIIQFLKRAFNNSDSEQKEMIKFFDRLNIGFKNGVIDQRGDVTGDNRHPQIDRLIEVLIIRSDSYYQIYSKYDHYSLYEISPMHSDALDKLKQIRGAFHVLIAALHYCLVGLKVETDLDGMMDRIWNKLLDLGD